MRWAYDVLGWGGYWSWDPVEVSALMPWLSGTALLHSVMIQEKKGMMKRWNMILAILTYDLVIFGTFLTRSGVLSSVHAFSESAIGPLFFAFIGITFVISLGLLLYRWNDLKEEGELASIFSRESMFLVNNLLFMGILVICFWGVLFPLISEIFTGQKITIGAPFYKSATGPLWLLIVLLMGVAPLSAWGASSYRSIGRAIWKPVLVSLIGLAAAYLLGVRSPVALLAFWVFTATICITLYEYGRSTLARAKITGENLPAAFWRLGAKNHRRYGGYIIHLGVVLMALGVIGIEMYQTQTQGTIKPGESLKLDGYEVRFVNLTETDTADNVNVARAIVDVYQDGRKIDELQPRRDYYYDSDQPMTIPGLHSTLEGDLYIILVDWQPISTDGATFKVFHNPLVNWLWLGGIVFLLGSIIAMTPDQEREK
jgi:cytochrome c-type biogenesis protein CcmF